MRFGEFLKQKRIEAGISQAKISDALGFTTPQYISNIERGKTRLSPMHWRKVARMVGSSVTEFKTAYMKDVERQLSAEINAQISA